MPRLQMRFIQIWGTEKVGVKEREKEREGFYFTIAVNDMIHESFKERNRDKYNYDSDDTESDYKPDEQVRENNREIKTLNKLGLSCAKLRLS